MEYAEQITTYRINPETRNCEEIRRECNIKRISPLTVEVEIQDGRILIKVDYFAEGWLEISPGLGKAPKKLGNFPDLILVK